jgi:hypothetical protein
MADHKPPEVFTASATVASGKAAPAQSSAPVLPPEIPQYFFPVRGSASVYQPVVAGAAKIQFVDPKRDINESRDVVFTTPIADDAVGANWDKAGACEDVAVTDLEKSPEPGIGFAELPPPAALPKNYTAWSKSFAAWLFRMQKLELMHSPSLDELSKPNESERDFRLRLQQAAREERDRLKASLQSKYGPELAALQERKRQAEQRKALEQQQSTGQMLTTAVSVGATILGAFMGRKTLSVTNINRAVTAARATGRAAKEYGDVERAGENVEAVNQQIADLNKQFEAELAAVETKVDPATEVFETVTILPKKTNIEVQVVALGWKAK